MAQDSKVCSHAPSEEELKEAKDLLGSFVIDEKGLRWFVDGVRFDAFDCDCAPMNYGTEISVFLSRGPYGEKEAKELFCGYLTEDGFGLYEVESESAEVYKIERRKP